MSAPARALVDELYARTTAPGRAFGEELYGPFLNWGYWRSETRDQAEACRNLAELVATAIPLGRSALDVGCGLGGLEAWLAEARPEVEPTGINVREDQLEVCRRRAPKATFRRMEATALDFPEGSFDAVVSIEAAFHFPSRARFLAEARRVLRPGGHLSIADIIGVPIVETAERIEGPEGYAELVRAAGFAEVRLSDVTPETSWAHAAHAIDYLRRRHAAGAIDDETLRLGIEGRLARAAACRHYVVLTARRPSDEASPWSGGRPYLDELRRAIVRTAGL